MKRTINELRREWADGRWTPQGREHFGGAGLIITDKELKDNAVVVVTDYASELSALVFELRDRLVRWLDFMNKYEFYPRLGEAANRCLESEGDVKDALISAVLNEAYAIAGEWYDLPYFAYGSNMDLQQMERRCPNARLVSKVTVPNYRFVLDGRGAASIVPQEGAIVEGLLWMIDEQHVQSLDRYEGIAFGCYRKECITVHMGCYRKVDALVYLSNHGVGTHSTRSNYLERIIIAAKEQGFSSEYITELEGWLG